jgi:hypothetical protein
MAMTAVEVLPETFAAAAAASRALASKWKVAMNTLFLLMAQYGG